MNKITIWVASGVVAVVAGVIAFDGYRQANNRKSMVSDRQASYEAFSKAVDEADYAEVVRTAKTFLELKDPWSGVDQRNEQVQAIYREAIENRVLDAVLAGDSIALHEQLDALGDN